MKLKQIKLTIFYIIVLIPTFILIGILWNVAGNVYRINNKIDHSAIYSEAGKYLRSSRGEAYAVVNKGEMSFGYVFDESLGGSEKVERTIPFAPIEGNYVVYVYGSSPVVAKPPFCQGRFKNFPVLLEEKLNGENLSRKAKVYNFALSSADSFVIEGIVKATVQYRKPDLIIYYYEGGMDYERVYDILSIKRKYYPLTIFSLGGFLKIAGLDKLEWCRKIGGYASWINRTYVQTDIINFLQAIGVLKVRIEPFQKINSLIFKDIEKNIYKVVDLVEKEGISSVFVTNLTNLEAKPFGVYDLTQKYYERGMREPDFAKKIEYLIQARDSELFTGDLGAKSEVYDVIRDLSRHRMENVYMFDLQRQMIKEGYGFDFDYFYDYGHMRPALHAIISQKLFVFIDDEGLMEQKN